MLGLERRERKMAYKLQIVDKNNNLNFSVRYSNLAKADKPQIVAKNDKGEIVKEKMCMTNEEGQILQGNMKRKWLDSNNNEYSKSELTFWYNDEQVMENAQTKVMEIEGYQPLSNYTDRYVISTYYETFPDINGMKKDIDRERAIKGNLYQMRKLWEYLDKNQVVARGEFCPSSRGFMASDAYIKIDNTKWGLEIGVFKEEKLFEHLNEKLPERIETVTVKSTQGKRLKMV